MDQPALLSTDLELDLDAPLAWRDGQALSRRTYLSDVHALAPRLPAAGPMLNLSADRYRFAVGLGAALLRGQSNLMPSNHTPDTLAQLGTLFPQAYRLDDELDSGLGDAPDSDNNSASTARIPRFRADAIAAQVLTSGSTGAPVPHVKRWGLLVANAQAGARRLAQVLGRPSLAGVTLVATVPAQHMYGFESSVLLALLGGAAFDAGRPFYPADIAAALARAPRPCVLVTTPFHLRLLLDAGVALPRIDLSVCATAPLTAQLAARAEAVLGAPLLEIYGCTEAGQIATRRTTAGPEWRVFDGLSLRASNAGAQVQGGHVPQPTLLGDVLDVIDAQTFRLLGRANDLINIAGKRSSLAHLNHHLNALDGVRDGAFWLPPEAPGEAAHVVRLVAFVVAADTHRAAPAIHALPALWRRALRLRIDAAFLPRRIVIVPALPRAPTGKLPVEAFQAWAVPTLARHLAERRAGQGAEGARAAGVPADVPADASTAPTPNPSPSPIKHRVAVTIALDHPAFAGHFPGRALLPGVALLAEVLEAALDVPALAHLVGAAPRLAVVKFLAPVLPGAELTLELTGHPASLRFEVREGPGGTRLAASGQFDAAATGPAP